jgi:hypothetical protein
MKIHLQRAIGLIGISLLFISQSAAQCSFENDYSKILVASSFERPDGQKALIDRVSKVDESLCYAEAVNGMPDFFNYLKTNFSDRSVYASLNLDLDSAKLNEAYKKAVNQDSKLTSKLQEFALKTYGTLPKEEYLFEELTDVAVKFFSIKDINENGQYIGKVCVGVNLIESTMDPRKSFLEAFAFSAIMENLKSSSPTLMTEFTDEVKDLYNLNLGLDKDERLLRAQGAIMLAMKNNGKLNAVLATYYAKYMDHLPFVIKGQ